MSRFAVVSILAGSCATSPPREIATGQPLAPVAEIEAIHVPDVPLPDPAQPGPVSLEAMLAYADAYAPRLVVARRRVLLGDAAIAAASPALPDNPELTFGAGPRFAEGGETSIDFQSSLSQRLEIVGERRSRRDAAARTRDRLVAELDEVRWEVHRDVHAEFHRAVIARERKNAAVRRLEFQENLLDISRRRFAAGDVSALAVRLAEGELAQARVAQIRANQEYDESRLRLALIAGWYSVNPPEPAGSLDQPREPPDHDSLFGLARNHQPRLRTLDAVRNEAVARARAADRDAWPEPTIGVEVERESAPMGVSEIVIVGLLTVPIPIVQRNQGERAEAHAAAEVAAAEQEAYGVELGIQIELARSAVMSAGERVRAYGSEILPTFDESLRLIERAFELGEIDVLEVTVALERVLRIQTDALDAYEEYFDAIADLEASVGTDIWPDHQHSVEEEPHEEAQP